MTATLPARPLSPRRYDLTPPADVETWPKNRLVDDVTDGAMCADQDPEPWQPARTDASITDAEAAAACEGCAVVLQCRELALRDEAHRHSHGIYGGWSPTQRRAAIAARKRAAREVSAA
jgi:hypothetical protein